MSHNPLEQSEERIRELLKLPPGEATRALFDQYRIGRADSQEAFVLALIGNLVSAKAIARGRRDLSALAEPQ